MQDGGEGYRGPVEGDEPDGEGLRDGEVEDQVGFVVGWIWRGENGISEVVSWILRGREG